MANIEMVDKKGQTTDESELCGQIYKNTLGDFLYKCYECQLVFNAANHFEEHVIVHFLKEELYDVLVEIGETGETGETDYGN